MEGPVKERLTGALILVAAVGIIAPEILSGPDPVPVSAPAAQQSDTGPPLLTYSMELNAPADAGAVTQATLAPQPAAAEPAPAMPEPASVPAAKPEPPAAPVQPVAAGTAGSTPDAARTVATKPTAAKADASASAAAGKWWTQLGSFAARDNADRLARKLRAEGYAIDVSRTGAAGKELFLVRAGPVQSRAEGEALQRRLAAIGYDTSFVVAP